MQKRTHYRNPCSCSAHTGKPAMPSLMMTSSDTGGETDDSANDENVDIVVASSNGDRAKSSNGTLSLGNSNNAAVAFARSTGLQWLSATLRTAARSVGRCGPNREQPSGMVKNPSARDTTAMEGDASDRSTSSLTRRRMSLEMPPLLVST